MTHELKCWPCFFDAVATGYKTFEVRKNDRNFQPGDVLTLREYDSMDHVYSGRETRKIVTYVLDQTVFPDALMKGYCVMGLACYPPSGVRP